MEIPEEFGFSVVIKTIDNSIHHVNVDRSTRISVLKQSIREATSIREDRQRLIYRGKVLIDDSSVKDYNIESGHTIHMVARPENYEELQQAARIGSSGGSSEQPSATASRGSVASLLNSLPLLERTESRHGTDSNSQNSPQFELSLEHIRQNLLTLRTLVTLIDQPSLRQRVDEESSSMHAKADADSDHNDDGGQQLLDEIERGRSTEGTTSGSTRRVRGRDVQFYIGQWVDVKDTVSQWLEATILDINVDEQKVFVHYNGWPERWDEWIAWDSPRICPFRSRTAHSALSSAPSSHTNHLSPQPNTLVLHAPVTGVNDIRTLLPEVASLFRLLLPIVEEAAVLAEESLQANPPPSMPASESSSSRSAATTTTAPYRRTSRSAVRNAAAEAEPSTATLLQIAPGMPWEHVGMQDRHTSRVGLDRIAGRHDADVTMDVEDAESHFAKDEGNQHHSEQQESFSSSSESDRRTRLRKISHSDSMEGIPRPLSYSSSSFGQVEDADSNQSDHSTSSRLHTRKRPAESIQWNRKESGDSPPHRASCADGSGEEKETRFRRLSQDLCPLIDRFGRVLSDIAPHLWTLSEQDVSHSSQDGETEAVTAHPLSLEASLLSLLASQRTPSPPHDRVSRAPISLNTRFTMGILPTSGMGLVATRSTGGSSILNTFLGDLTGSSLGNASHVISSGAGPSTVRSFNNPSSGTGSALTRTGSAHSGRQVDIHIAILAPSSMRQQSAISSSPATALMTTIPTVNQRVASLSSSLQAQTELLVARTRQLSERTQQMTGYSAAIHDVLRSLSNQTTAALESSSSGGSESSASAGTEDDAVHRTVESTTMAIDRSSEEEPIDANDPFQCVPDCSLNFVEVADDDEEEEGEGEGVLLDDLIPNLSFSEVFDTAMGQSSLSMDRDSAQGIDATIEATVAGGSEMLSSENDFLRDAGDSSSDPNDDVHILPLEEAATASNDPSSDGLPSTAAAPTSVFDRIRRSFLFLP